MARWANEGEVLEGKFDGVKRLNKADGNKRQIQKGYMKSNERTQESGTDRLVTDLKRVVHDSQDLLQSSAEVAGDKARAMRERLAGAMESAKETCRKLEAKAAAGAKATDKVIRENPYQSIGIAFGIGLLIGVLVTRK